MRTNLKITILIVLLLILITNNLQSEVEPPSIVWEKTYSVNNYELAVATSFYKLKLFRDNYYLLFDGGTKLPGFSIFTFFPGLISTDINGNELIRYQLTRDTPHPLLDNSIYPEDIAFNNDTITIAQKALMPQTGASVPQILKFKQNETKPFFRYPDTVLSAISGINRISILNEGVGNFSYGHSYLISDFSLDSIIRYYNLNNIRELYPDNNYIRFDDRWWFYHISNNTITNSYKIDKESYGKHVLVQFDITKQPADINWTVEYDGDYKYGFYSEIDSIFRLITWSKTNEDIYSILEVNFNGEIINQTTTELKFVITQVIELKNQNYFAVCGWYPAPEDGPFYNYWLTIYDKGWNEIESYKWRPQSNPTGGIVLADMIEKDNGNIVVFGNIIQNSSLYLAEIHTTFTSVQNEIKQNIPLSVYPLPTSDYLYLNSDFEGQNIEVYSLLRIKQMELSYESKVDVSNLNSGIYYIKVGTKIVKFVKI